MLCAASSTRNEVSLMSDESEAAFLWGGDMIEVADAPPGDANGCLSLGLGLVWSLCDWEAEPRFER